ncbi:TolC family protein [Novosphingobium sp.]|uniref:TolC family protein n=1 Tax=Novosphingobium sp. TaxID=1874826 RepID=UPI002733F019|nr:TolC family protein [Novosphingobium sp.]MDP3907812.1 TolC family protein [Novosphingobium sp.]
MTRRFLFPPTLLVASALLASSALLTTPVFANPALPPETAVREALEAHPAVQAAVNRIAGAKADQRILKAGSHELVFAGSYVRRSVDREGRYDEYDATLSRAFRLPGKARLDRTAGELGLIAAENLAEDARHQIALRLNELWWDWVEASAEAAVDQAGVGNYRATLTAVQRRVELRDAPQLEADQAAAALGDAQALAAQSQGRADLARARLAAQFPGLPLPVDAPEPPSPALPLEGLATLRDQVIARSHEIAAADAEAGRLAALADRAARDRLADPTVGVRLFSERGGAERGAGLVFSMPLGSGARGGMAAKVAAEAQAASAELAAVRLDVQETADADRTEAEAAFTAWRFAREALGAQSAALGKLRRGQQLGAIDLSEVLLGERLTHLAFRTEAKARADASRKLSRLLIDSHNLWISD